jgi:hypothetical protein
MSFWDFLKGIIPEKFININVDNRKIEINSSSIIFGDEIINDPNLVDKVLNKLSQYKDQETLPAQIIHKDLDRSYREYEELTIKDKESIKKLRTLLPESEIECILMARRVKLAYDKKEVELAKELHKKLCDYFPDKGNKVYNLIGAGYFDEMIIPFIDIFKSQYDDKYPEKFREFYFGIIKFFPLAVFVSNYTSKEQIMDRINERLKLSVPFIRLHAIGEVNISKIDEILNKITFEDNPTIQDNRFTSPSGIKVQILEIRFSNEKDIS